ncbi:MAG: Crp/Fnr family transcriptional regulator [Zetaproteobacteria bacterium CG02_land_8_20_14_3_00_50_9]|nr:MAG: Crp/Fnr family transcriptional regulator [Zetaproteobacteria bacterium CG1_02_49_23]PIQ34149.1 MAG: Crp/Fnr family transcriptional regulator [Zetaproteobacteria bacterium CG17_big_fil_post_rev_8_21_14_2_50_50_13]PIV30776.1 MAG: Crp/Fnr family transcriptional regulator [Zetaproteobacteria bacterium CG02_land_8_20_14_3_00_50_9]PIY54971.1 MAG: Crp/Fnr family transcriptional regulator [Zetaproteobacteria bacterium CG_4_10_14_0_8_um_filter_49_80]
MPHKTSDPANRLLASLPDKDYQRFISGCEEVNLEFGKILSEAKDCIHYVYFPIKSYISQTTAIDEHDSLGVGMIGDEGMLGISLILGINHSPLRALVQGPGTALRMSAERFRHELEQSSVLKHDLDRYLYAVMGQLEQTAACIRFHVVEARLARWLLMTLDRAHSNEFHITHELLASMLGVRRVGITKAASDLQHRKLISYKRGAITVLDHLGLEAASCGCYEADKSIYQKMMTTSDDTLQSFPETQS